MKKTLLLVTSFLFTLNVFSQVGIGTTNILNGVEFQIESNSRGLLIPRVALTATNVLAPIGPAPIATGVLIFNTATAGSGITAVSPGFYYWSGTEWVALKSNTLAASQDWSLTGNAGTNPSTNFLGTTDNQNFQIRTNNSNRVTIENDGQVIFGNNTTPSANTSGCEKTLFFLQFHFSKRIYLRFMPS